MKLSLQCASYALMNFRNARNERRLWMNSTIKFFDIMRPVMINEKCAKCYCSEDIALIENYQEAISDEERIWDIHHRRECDENGKTLFTKKQLKEMNLYFNRPASELMFVTRAMHWKLHREMRSNGGKIGGKISGGSKAAKEATKEKLSIPILQFSKDWTLIKEWPSAREAERQLGISQSSICKCLKGRCKSAGGYIWRYSHG